EALSEVEGVNISPDDVFDKWLVGKVWLIAGKLPEAEAALRQVVSLAGADLPGCVRAVLAYCLVKQGNPDEARSELIKIANDLAKEKFDEDLPYEDLLYFAAKTYSELGDVDQAQTLAGRFIEHWPQHPWAAEMRKLIQ
ncbi:MAG: tetratricopeptide repeat protein, partial [Armatimonadetes bacterium]|nr:tetratricopeptide repeat protein [Armatimonadota bacterium]